MVRHDVEQYPQVQGVGQLQQPVELLHGAEERVHAAIVAHVVALVHLRGGLERRHPDAVHTQRGDVREACGQPGEVAHAVAVPVREGARIHLVDDGGLPPAGDLR
ncbi:hypothetical protein FQZ97_1131050 [compost metagenome]